MAARTKSSVERNLITALIALIAVAVVIGFYWDGQKQRVLQQPGFGLEAEPLNEWEAEARQRTPASTQGQPVAFPSAISYKNIVAKIAPSAVSVNVTSGFVTQGGALQNVRGGRMGGWGMGPGGYLVCPNCGTKVPHQRGIPAYTVQCPSCGTRMVREGAPSDPAQQGLGLAPSVPRPPSNQGGNVGAWGNGPVDNLAALVAAPQGQAAPSPETGEFRTLGSGGSGVIINRIGYLLTNHHVVHGARTITVTVSSGRISKTYPAQLVDEAPNLDLAVLKIQTKGNETFIPAMLGDSNAASIGDEVLAVGSPFGLQQTVTFGIVSNTDRTLAVGNKTFYNILQTDAPINPGSSGGPLVNMRGEVIGINMAIYSPTQAFSGIGFASPINPARAAFAQFAERTQSFLPALMANAGSAPGRYAPGAPTLRGQGLYPWCPPGGGVRQAATLQYAPGAPTLRGQGLYPWCPPGRGVRQVATLQNLPWLGVRVRPIDKATKSLLKLPMSRGVVVMEVFGNSPCELAGLQGGDVILRFNNRSIKDDTMFATLLSRRKPGDKIKLTVYRDGKRLSVRPILGVAPTPLQVQAAALPSQPLDPANAPPPGLTGPLKGSEVGAGEIEALGMGVEDLAPELALAYGIPQGEKGVVIAESAGQAQQAGLLAGDVIKAVNYKKVESVFDFIKVMGKADLKRGILFDISRQGQRFQIEMKGN